jgi:anhydro-N-acetylmuramic acid kinase
MVDGIAVAMPIKKQLAKSQTLRVAGLMSGTSADGIDVAIIDLSAQRLRVLAFGMFPYRRAMREAIFRLFDPHTSGADEISAMNVAVGECFADALIRLAARHKIPLESIDLAGSHGQTIWHEPGGRVVAGRRVCSTLQIGEPSVIAQRTGITTVADFRPRDIAAGGQGAPLVPLADLILLGHATRSRAVQNIGGIANVTFLPEKGTGSDFVVGNRCLSPFLRKAFGGLFPPDSAITGVRAFDTGPGNMIIDRAMQLLTNGRRAYDKSGAMAARGTVDRATLAELMRHPYFRRRPPKTTGRELFGRQFTDKLVARLGGKGLALADIIATVTAFTARSIADAYRRFLPRGVDEVIVCGGGARNDTLLSMLRREIPGAKVMTMDELGINADAKEAISFAILAAATWLGLPGNVPAATGAKQRVVLGKIIPGRLRLQ